MSRARDWAKLGDSWYANKKVRKVTRKYGPVAGGYLALLIARTYAASDESTNPEGALKTTLQDLADDLYDRRARPQMWEEMVSAKLVTIRGDGWQDDPFTDVVITLNDFADWQHAKGSAARRQMEAREKKKSLSRETSQTVTDRHATVTVGHQRREEERREEENTPPPTPAPTTRTLTASVGADGEERYDFYRAATSGGFSGAPAATHRAVASVERTEFTTELRQIVRPVTADEAGAIKLAALVYDRAQRPIRRGEGAVPLDAWLRAARVMVRQHGEGKRVEGDPMALLVGMAPSYLEPGSDEPVALREPVRPDSALTLDERNERTRRELEERAKQLMGESA